MIYYSFGCKRKNDQGVIIGDLVNIRNKPNTESKVVLQLNKYDKVSVIKKIETQNKFKEWYKISHKKKEGFIYKDYIKLISKGDSILNKEDGFIIKFQKNQLLIKSILNDKIYFSKKFNPESFNDYTHVDNLKFKDFSYTIKNFSNTFNKRYFLISIKLNIGELFFAGIFDFYNKTFLNLPKKAYSPSIIDVSKSKRYIAIDDGTGATRSLEIIDGIKRKTVYETHYLIKSNKYMNKWHDDKFIFQQYDRVAKDCPNLPKNKDYNAYEQQVYWYKGKIGIIKKCIFGYAE